MIVEPESVEQVSDALAGASRDRSRVLVRGAGTKLTWGVSSAAPAVDVTLATTKLDAVLAHRHGDLTATVQAGARLADVNRTLAQHGQWIPLDPPWADRATIGGIVATNDSGPRRHRYGAPRDLIIGAEFVRADGTVAKAGGIVVKNVAGYDVSRLLTGSFGTLAVVVSATFKLFPLPEASRTVIIDLTVDRLGAFLAALASTPVTPSAVELQAPPTRVLVRFETIGIAAEQQAVAVLALAHKHGGTATIVGGEEEATSWAGHRDRVWRGAGTVVKVTLLPTAVAQTAVWLAESLPGLDYDLVGRAGVGVLLLRVAGDVEEKARVLAGLRSRLPPPAGSAVLVRGSDSLASRVDAWGPMGDAVGVMRAIKQRFDPLGILNPGRGPGGL